MNSVLHTGLVPKLNLVFVISITSWSLKGLCSFNQISILEDCKTLSLIKFTSGVGGSASLSKVFGMKNLAFVSLKVAGLGPNPMFPKCQLTYESYPVDVLANNIRGPMLE